MCSSIHSCLSDRLALVALFQFFFGRPDWHRNQVKRFGWFLVGALPMCISANLSTWNPTRSRSTSETTPAHRCGDDDDNTHTCHPWLCVCVCPLRCVECDSQQCDVAPEQQKDKYKTKKQKIDNKQRSAPPEQCKSKKSGFRMTVTQPGLGYEYNMTWTPNHTVLPFTLRAPKTHTQSSAYSTVCDERDEWLW